MFALAGLALASGPTWTGRTPVGELRPGKTATRLVYEEIEIAITGLDTYELRATYQVHNPGEAEVIRFAVPVTSGGTGGSERSSEEAASVRVLSQGVFVPCLVREGERLELPIASRHGANVIDRWCTSDLTLAPGSSEIRMSFEGALFWEGASTPEALVAGGGERTLIYDLTGASGWAGRPDAVAITIDLGPYAGRAEATRPTRQVASGRLLSWELGPDELARPTGGPATSLVHVALRGGELVRRAQIASHNRLAPASVRPDAVTVSGAAKGSAAEHLLDGDPDTAWCAPPGPGAWAELRWKDPLPLPASCSLALLALPGDRAERWSASGRPTRVRVGACGGEGSPPVDAVELALPPASTAASAGAAALVTDPLRARWLADRRAGPACALVEVLASEGGESACFAELSWQIGCTPE